MSVRIGRGLRLDPEFLGDFEHTVPLHDIGKLTIPPWILAKRGPLTEYERAVMRTHTLAGARLLRATGEPSLELASEIAESHHEWWDGRGYPHGLVEDEIPIGARIVAVADVFDALLHERPYKPAWPRELAIEGVGASAGAQFDPDVVEAFLSCARGSSAAGRRPRGAGGIAVASRGASNRLARLLR
jgi:putative two-component system response regulator